MIEAILWAGAEIKPTIFPLSSSIEGRVARKLILSRLIFSPSYPPPIILNFSSFLGPYVRYFDLSLAQIIYMFRNLEKAMARN